MAKSSKSTVTTGPIVAETFGTFVLTSAVLSTVYATGGAVVASLVAALTLTVLVLVIGSKSGAHVNPAVTLGMLAAGKIDSMKAGAYWLAQFAGALVALLVVTSLANADTVNQLPATADSLRAVTAEGIGAAIFVFGISATIAQGYKGLSLAFGVGFSLLVGLVIASSGSAGVINPAISVGLTGIGDLQWEYVIGPLVGGAIGAYSYKMFADLK